MADRSWGKNVVIFAVDNSSSVHVHNKTEDILVLGEGPIQRLDDTAITSEAVVDIVLILQNQESDLC